MLALGKKRVARVQLAWCFDVGCVREKMDDVYECLACLLEKKDTNVFNKSVLSRAQNLFSGIDVFRDLFSRSDVMLGTQTHKKILNAFLKSRTLLY